ncbi:glycosyltransferase family 2 protein [Microbacterium jiangjiandongii]|uniref:glycosyltransferase family 2 protein n=1 Tax=Microbacterium jiangjiandongii TaxID=3049071 RepID=UPI00214C6583|nr:glycosyltransferase family 2 protein [Microbacterium sp. zg.Y843]MCR2816164.1 glycosyltransferase [Microbacterium sp. zg.Y843]
MSDESRPRVGIVVRTKNRPWFLRRTLADIASQTFTDTVVTIVNDGGAPAPVDAVVAEAAGPLRARLSVIHNDVATGRSAAANAGVRATQTEFIVLHDDDDLWHPEFLSRTVAHLDGRGEEIGVVAETEIVYEAERDGGFAEVGRAPFWPGMTEITYADLLQVNRAVPIAYLYRRRLHDDVGFYREDLHAAEDWEFNLRAALRHRIGYLPGEPLAYWMQRKGVTGELGNSMYALAAEHEHYDRLVRDEALRAYVQQHGPGLVLYLSRYIQDEVARQLDDRRSLGQRVTHTLREWRRDRRTR